MRQYFIFKSSTEVYTIEVLVLPLSVSEEKSSLEARVAEPDPVGTGFIWGLRNQNRIRNMVPVPGTSKWIKKLKKIYLKFNNFFFM